MESLRELHLTLEDQNYGQIQKFEDAHIAEVHGFMIQHMFTFRRIPLYVPETCGCQSFSGPLAQVVREGMKRQNWGIYWILWVFEY